MLHAMLKSHPNVCMMCTSSVFTNWAEEVLLLDTLVKRFLFRPHPLLTHILVDLGLSVAKS